MLLKNSSNIKEKILMETIKSYLEAMFASMPNTFEVRKAKAELLQMMEDKYNELISEGQSENTAVGTVISEFGNLDELAEDLGLVKEVEVAKGMEAEIPSRYISLEESESFIAARRRKSLLLSLGILLCIISVGFPGLDENFITETLGVSLMFVSIALGVGLIILSSLLNHEWTFVEEENCRIDMNTASHLKEKRRSFESVRALCVTLGVILCIICWLPMISFSFLPEGIGNFALFLLVGIGVFLIVYSNLYESIGFSR